MSQTQRYLFVVAVVLGAFGLAGAASQASAQAVLPVAAAVSAPVPALDGVADAQVLDAVEYRGAAAFTQRVTPHIVLDARGVPQLGDVSGAELGVDEAYLERFRQALGFASQAILEGHIRVNADLTVEKLGPKESWAPQVGVVPIDPAFDATAKGSAGEEGRLDWQTWRYNQGAMFYNSYTDYFSYYYNRYYILCGSMAAAVGYPWISTNLVYFYTYNNQYFNQYCYANYGMYYFLPYSNTGSCQAQYSPCYCCGLSYRAVYVWTVMYRYVPNCGCGGRCGCQQSYWGWQGFWGRY